MPNPESAAIGRWKQAERVLPLATLAVLLIVGISALYFQLSLPGRLPRDGAYREVAATLAKEALPEDVLLLYPWWIERVRLFVSGTPVVGYLGSDGNRFSAHARIWVLAQPELPRFDRATFERKFLPGRLPLKPPRRFGTLELSLYRNGFYRPVVFSAVREYRSARVYVEDPGTGRLDCPFDGKVHRCAGADQLRVAAEWHELLYEPRLCLWMHPPGGSRRIVAEFPALPLGDRLALEAGIVGEYASGRQPELTPVRAAVEDIASGARLLELAISPGQEGMQSAERPVSGDRPVALRIWVQSDNPASRETCLELSSDRAAPR